MKTRMVVILVMDYWKYLKKTQPAGISSGRDWLTVFYMQRATCNVNSLYRLIQVTMSFPVQILPKIGRKREDEGIVSIGKGMSTGKGDEFSLVECHLMEPMSIICLMPECPHHLGQCPATSNQKLKDSFCKIDFITRLRFSN